MRSLLITEAGIPAEELVSVLSYDGMPLTPGWVLREIEAVIGRDKTVVAAMPASARAGNVRVQI